MSWVRIQPRYQPLLRHFGLREAGDFLRLPGVILCGHPDRHVLQVNLEPGDASFGMYLKREHRVPWRERLASWRAGFGFVSRSEREARVLELLQKSGIGCPEVLAVGEDAGRAFLLLLERKHARDLREYLSQPRPLEARRTLAIDLGVALARMHLAGFSHSELFAKHVLVADADNSRFCLLDWQRASIPQTLSERERLNNVAALDASLSSSLANRCDRLAFLRAYCREIDAHDDDAVRRAAKAINASSDRLRSSSRVREQRQPALPKGEQNLIWLDGERLCITRQLRDRYAPLLPELLRRVEEPLPVTSDVETSQLLSGAEGNLTFIRRRSSRCLSWLSSLCRRRSFVSPDFEHAATIFRLQRHGIQPPKLLAVGQTFERPWRTESFLLMETPDAELDFVRFLEWCHPRDRSGLLHQGGQLLKQLHEASYHVTSLADWAVQPQGEPAPVRGRIAQRYRVILAGVTGLVRAKYGFDKNLVSVLAELKPSCTRTDLFRFRRGYDGIEPRARVTQSRHSARTAEVAA